MANFEENSGDILKMVSMLERHLIKGGTFNSTSIPSLEQAEEALSEAEAEMFAWLAGGGFSISIADYPVAAKKYLAWFAALGTAYRLELSHPGIQSSPRGSSRWQVLKGQYETLQKVCEGLVLDRLGVVRNRGTLSVITGVSHDDKEILSTDTDAVQPAFVRDIFRHPGRMRSSQVIKELP
ncbi:hypothetical protein LCGC14_1311360 [marine sediment metagenome]|uniref:Uncharacterized protein n=1 Tax=marine sediment metagenome TaxID=412755 RepID=A0A0F9L7B1_9ZZZZ